MKNILYVAETDAQRLKKINASALRFARELADRYGGELIAVLLGAQAARFASELACFAVDKVVTLSEASLDAELAGELSSACVGLAEAYDARFLVTPSSTRGKDFMPRVAAKLEAAMLSDCIGMADEDGAFRRPIWASKIVEVLQTHSERVCFSVRHTAFEPLPQDNEAAPIESFTFSPEGDGARFVRFDAVQSARPDLTDAEVVVSGGRGLKNEEGFKLVETFADLLGGAVGATRGAVDAGFCPNDYQVGQTGKIVAPQVYFAFGISGAIQHLAGMKSSKLIIAINKNGDEPIFKVADYGLVDDIFKSLPVLIDAVKAAKQE
ncbi:MAG: electron transfer flavoprotein subunit alpha/FixB family protein [Myxococcota bacterium]|jgi:electron transfer flavoprotein alpha subunit|nr:electron transfer flavoprotein subunit alpha/FixB family protein [Myxococcota bacterium]